MVQWQNLPKYSFNAKELDEETGMYYYEARYYAPPTFTSRDPLFEKYFWMSPYAYCANNPVKYVDPDGREIILVIWTTGTESNGVGHVGIAVSNYKEENGKMVPDGTYTFYDNWPGTRVDFDLKGALTSVEAHRNVEIIKSFDEFTNGSTVSPSEEVAPNAVLKLNTTYEQDMATTERLLNANQNKDKYNGAWYNCSSYVSDGLKAIFGKTIGKESMLGPIKSITPNQLWKDTLKAAEKNGIPFLILKDPGSEVDNIFKNVMKANNNDEEHN